VIVCDLDIVGAIRHPSETDAPLVVDSDAMLPRTITFQFLQAIARRSQQVLESAALSSIVSFRSATLRITGELSDGIPGKQALCLLIPKTSDHGPYAIIVLRFT
jgi:hypothetical protein